MAKKKRYPPSIFERARNEGAHQRHLAVIDAWFANGFDRRAAMAAGGYSSLTCQTRDASVFNRPEVKAEIARRNAILRAKSEVTAEEVIGELKKIAFANMGDLVTVLRSGDGFIDLNKLTPDQRACIVEFAADEYVDGRGPAARKVKRNRIKFADKKGALELLARYLGLFNDKLQISGEAGLIDKLLKGRERVNKPT